MRVNAAVQSCRKGSGSIRGRPVIIKVGVTSVGAGRKSLNWLITRLLSMHGQSQVFSANENEIQRVSCLSDVKPCCLRNCVHLLRVSDIKLGDLCGFTPLISMCLTC